MVQTCTFNYIKKKHLKCDVNFTHPAGGKEPAQHRQAPGGKDLGDSREWWPAEVDRVALE